MTIRINNIISRHNESNKFAALVLELNFFIENRLNHAFFISKIREILEIPTHQGYIMTINTISEMINIDNKKSIIKKYAMIARNIKKKKIISSKKKRIIELVPKLYECIAIGIKNPIKYKHFKKESKG
ncbi:hypothetical protein DMUE_3868 [Dictyocoela muelleri]|nr:hypothetical protein DMUE_3868 [Dictyocoela muelleri]